MSAQSLDYAFLRYFGISASGEATFHGFYLPFFERHRRILDLGSGMGGFVRLLRDAGKDAYGVDADPGCVAESRRLDVPIVEADVLDHLRAVAPDSLDGIFSAHLVEHLPYEVTLDVVKLAHRALRPGGRLLLVTPNPRALISHLELYHQHFGHVSFYQPELLAFFLHHCGFASIETGENPDTSPEKILPHSAIGQIAATRAAWTQPGDPGSLAPERLLPRPGNPLRRLIWYPKLFLIRWLVQPFTDQLAGRERAMAEQMAGTTARLDQLTTALVRPFEGYVVGDKPGERMG